MGRSGAGRRFTVIGKRGYTLDCFFSFTLLILYNHPERVMCCLEKGMHYEGSSPWGLERTPQRCVRPDMDLKGSDEVHGWT